MSIERLVLAALSLGVLADGLAAQTAERRCGRDSFDSAYVARVGALLSCDVDQAARLRVDLPLDGWDFPASGTRCFRTALVFVVDTAGAPEANTVEITSRNNEDMARQVRSRVPMLRYEPARDGGRRVRQIVLYRSAIAAQLLQFTTPGASQPRPRAQTC